MKPPAASPGRAEKPQLAAAPAPPGLARLLLSKSRRGGGGGRSRRAPPATSPMFVSRRGHGRAAGAAADGEPSSPKVTCIGQVRMRKGKMKKSKKAAAAGAGSKTAPDNKASKGYCRCLKKAFLCGGLFQFDRRRRAKDPQQPPEVVERSRRSPWVFSSRDVAVAAAPKPADARSVKAEEDEEMEVGVGVFGSVGRREDAEEEEEPGGRGGATGIVVNDGAAKEQRGGDAEAELVSSATTTPPKNALLLMRCRSAPQNGTSPLMSRFAVAEPTTTTTRDAVPPADIAAYYLSPSPQRKPALSPAALSPSPRRSNNADDRSPSPAPSPSPRRKSETVLLADEEQRQVQQEQAQEGDESEQEEDLDDDEEMRCSSARPLVLPRCKSEPATTAAAKLSGGPLAADAATGAGCFWANGGSSGRRRHAPAAPVVALTGH